jgi:hypothetical protein
MVFGFTPVRRQAAPDGREKAQSEARIEWCKFLFLLYIFPKYRPYHPCQGRDNPDEFGPGTVIAKHG